MTERIKAFLEHLKDGFLDFLSQQRWFRQMSSQWDELPPQSKNALFLGSTVGSTFIGCLMLLLLWLHVHSLGQELKAQDALLVYLHQAEEDLIETARMIPPNALRPRAADKNWPLTIQEMASQAVGCDKENIKVSEPQDGEHGEQADEVMMNVRLHHINIKQLVKVLYALESGQSAVKIRHMLIDTQPDLSGYLDLTLAVSCFTLKKES